MFQLHKLAFAFVLLAILPAGASCEPARSASDVAEALGAALLRGDNEAAASFLTGETRQLFLDLKQSEARLRKARTDLDAAIGARFALADRDRMIRPSSTDSVDRVETVGHRVTGAITADVDIKLTPGSPGRTARVSTWRAMQEGGTWQIELPACTPAIGAVQNRQLQDVIAAIGKVAVALGEGRFADAGAARGAWSDAEVGAFAQARSRGQP